MTDYQRSKMVPAKDAPRGLETDGRGNVIPFQKRTNDDQEMVMGNIATKIHGTPSEDQNEPPSPTPRSDSGPPRQ